jgi:hypothetical protein
VYGDSLYVLFVPLYLLSLILVGVLSLFLVDLYDAGTVIEVLEAEDERVG